MSRLHEDIWVVFTLPAQLRPVAVRRPRLLYGLLFRAASDVLTTLGREVLGGRLGVTMVLHTWTRELLLHPLGHTPPRTMDLTARPAEGEGE